MSIQNNELKLFNREGDSITIPSYFEKFHRHLLEVGRVLITPFIRLRKGDKEPDGAWSAEKFHMSGDDALKRLKTGKNVGIVAHPEGLVFLDIDVEGGKTKLPANKVMELIDLFDTFTVQTRNGGRHFYFVNEGISENSLLYYDNINIGEIRVSREYIVAPGSSMSPDENATPDTTGIYTVIRDVPIKTLTLDLIPEWIQLGRKSHNKRLNDNQSGKCTELIPITGFRDVDIDTISNRYGKSLKEIRTSDLEFSKELDELLTGAGQGEFTSRSEADFRTVKILWKYLFEETEIAAILHLCRPYDKTQREDYLSRTITRAIEDAQVRGWVRESKLIPQTLPVTSLERVSITQLPDDLPDKKYVLVRGVPRTGKTRWAVQQLLKAPDGNFVSHRHSITRHAIEEFKKQNSRKTAVLLMGKEACCNRDDGEKGRCADCSKHLVADDNVEEGNGVSRTQYFCEAYSLLNDNFVLTDREIPQHLCPFFTLMFAERYADYCFTVPYFYANEDKTVLIKRRALVVLDEDPVVDSFYPTTIALAEYLSKTGRVFNAKNVLSDYLHSLDKLEEHIQSLNRRYASDRKILDIIRVIRGEINPIIAKLVETPIKEYKEELVDKLNEVELPNLSNEERREILKRVKHHLKKLPRTFHVSLSSLFEPFLFPAQKRYLWIGHNPNTLYLVGDRTIFRHREVEQLIIIGSTNAELFLEQLCAGSPQDATILDIAEFRYKDNFTVFKMCGENKKHEDRMMMKFIHLLAEMNRNRDDSVPGLILTSSKKNQEHLWGRLQSLAIMSRDENADDQITNWLTGKLNIFYANSTISRGIDLPYYDILLVHSCNFAQPFWDSEIKRAHENGDWDAEMRARMIRSHIIGDELTNSVLRHSPVRGVREEQAKFIVFKSRDFKKISEKVTSGMKVFEVRNDAELRYVAANVPKMATRASQSGVRANTGFYDVFPVSNKDSTSLNPAQVMEGTALILGKSYQEAKAFFEKGFAAVISSQNIDNIRHPEISQKILQYPSFLRKCRGAQCAIVRWMRHRDSKVSARKVKQTLRQMVVDGILRREIGTRNRVMYSLRAENIGERGDGLSCLTHFKEIVEASP